MDSVRRSKVRGRKESCQSFPSFPLSPHRPRWDPPPIRTETATEIMEALGTKTATLIALHPTRNIDLLQKEMMTIGTLTTLTRDIVQARTRNRVVAIADTSQARMTRGQRVKRMNGKRKNRKHLQLQSLKLRWIVWERSQ